MAGVNGGGGGFCCYLFQHRETKYTTVPGAQSGHDTLHLCGCGLAWDFKSHLTFTVQLFLIWSFDQILWKPGWSQNSGLCFRHFRRGWKQETISETFHLSLENTVYTVHSQGSCFSCLNSIITHSVLQCSCSSEFTSESQIECTNVYINITGNLSIATANYIWTIIWSLLELW